MDNRPILVVCVPEREADAHICQILSKARDLAAQSGKQVCAADAGIFDPERVRRFSEGGAQQIYFSECGALTGIRGYCAAMETLIRQADPEIVLFPATESGKIIAAVLSARFEAGLTADCIDVVYDAEQIFHFYRAAISDSVIANITGINSRISMGTVKEGVFREKHFADAAEVTLSRTESDAAAMEFLDEILQKEPAAVQESQVDISQYPIVFCIGRGAGKAETVQKVYQLAENYHACVTGTKAVVDEQILGKEYQVGQSGKSVSPRVYLGLGVFGASQHLVGMQNADLVIAVNRDANAPIMKYADYAVHDDVDAFLDKMLAAIS
ncbi:MAG TPA: electron transfer flavoprotein subunit alpha/FixB family protein [Ruminococcus sp.]|nr:electron transfer flavoprotein subunit alpha/FixB family protein [Ruminococcus sp.]